MPIELCPQFLRYLEYKKNLHIGLFLLFKISKKLQTFLKIVGSFFKVTPSTQYIQKIKKRDCVHRQWLYVLDLNLLKNSIFFVQKTGFFVIQIAIISVTKIWRHEKSSLVYRTRCKWSTSQKFYPRFIWDLDEILGLVFPNIVIGCISL